MIIRRYYFSDGWTDHDLVYRWKSEGPVQFAPNLTLPGGFKMDSFDNVNCDVKTATGNHNSTKNVLNILEQKKGWKSVQNCSKNVSKTPKKP